MHIAVAGNIGAGKTTLTELLSKHYGWTANYEDVDDNPNKTLFDLMASLIQPPDLLIYLKASIPTLVSQIEKRGREYENSIRLDYLRQLNDRYEKWIKGYTLGKLLIINVDDVNFASSKEDLSTVINKIDAQIHGLF